MNSLIKTISKAYWLTNKPENWLLMARKLTLGNDLYTQCNDNGIDLPQLNERLEYLKTLKIVDNTCKLDNIVELCELKKTKSNLKTCLNDDTNINEIINSLTVWNKDAYELIFDLIILGYSVDRKTLNIALEKQLPERIIKLILSKGVQPDLSNLPTLKYLYKNHKYSKALIIKLINILLNSKINEDDTDEEFFDKIEQSITRHMRYKKISVATIILLVALLMSNNYLPLLTSSQPTVDLKTIGRTRESAAQCKHLVTELQKNFLRVNQIEVAREPGKRKSRGQIERNIVYNKLYEDTDWKYTNDKFTSRSIEIGEVNVQGINNHPLRNDTWNMINKNDYLRSFFDLDVVNDQYYNNIDIDGLTSQIDYLNCLNYFDRSIVNLYTNSAVLFDLRLAKANQDDFKYDSLAWKVFQLMTKYNNVKSFTHRYMMKEGLEYQQDQFQHDFAEILELKHLNDYENYMIEHLHENQDEYLTGLPTKMKHELDQLKNFIQAYFDKFNKKVLFDDISELLRQDLNAIIENAPPLIKPMVVFRGEREEKDIMFDYTSTTSENQYQKMTKNLTLINKKHQSTSLSFDGALSFADSFHRSSILKIYVLQPGTKVLFALPVSQFQSELEIITPSNLELRLITSSIDEKRVHDAQRIYAFETVVN